MRLTLLITLCLIFFSVASYAIVPVEDQPDPALKKRINKGDTEAMLQLARSYYYGQDRRGRLFKQDGAEAMEWFLKAAEGGNEAAQQNLGVALALGTGGIPQNIEEAKKWLAKSAAERETNHCRQHCAQPA